MQIGDMKMNLFELTTELQNAMENIRIDPETGEATGFEAVDALDIAFDDKAEGYALAIKNLLAFADSAKTEADNMNASAKAAKAKADKLKEHLSQSMAAVGKTKIETARAALSFRKSVSVKITDDESIPDELFKVTVKKEPNKTEIGKLLKSGE